MKSTIRSEVKRLMNIHGEGQNLHGDPKAIDAITDYFWRLFTENIKPEAAEAKGEGE